MTETEGLWEELEKAAGVKLASKQAEGMYMTGTSAGIKQYRSLKRALMDQKRGLVGSLCVRTTTGALWIKWDKDPKYVQIRHITSEERMHDILPPAKKVRAYPLFSVISNRSHEKEVAGND